MQGARLTKIQRPRERRPGNQRRRGQGRDRETARERLRSPGRRQREGRGRVGRRWEVRGRREEGADGRAGAAGSGQAGGRRRGHPGRRWGSEAARLLHRAGRGGRGDVCADGSMPTSVRPPVCVCTRASAHPDPQPQPSRSPSAPRSAPSSPKASTTFPRSPAVSGSSLEPAQPGSPSSEAQVYFRGLARPHPSPSGPAPSTSAGGALPPFLSPGSPSSATLHLLQLPIKAPPYSPQPLSRLLSHLSLCTRVLLVTCLTPSLGLAFPLRFRVTAPPRPRPSRSGSTSQAGPTRAPPFPGAHPVSTAPLIHKATSPRLRFGPH